VSLNYVLVAVLGVASGFLLNEFGARHPVETVLVAILICGVATLCWAAVRMLRDASRKVDTLLDDELGNADEDHFAESAAISVRDSRFRGVNGVTTAFLRGDVVRKPNGMWSAGPKA
jgi:threonine/homoserine/homoserine lactone efflux protein